MLFRVYGGMMDEETGERLSHGEMKGVSYEKEHFIRQNQENYGINPISHADHSIGGMRK